MRCVTNKAYERWSWRVVARGYVIMTVALILVGCSTSPPQVWTRQITPDSFGDQGLGAEQVWPRSDWWRNLRSAELSDLIERAQGANRDLAVAVARIREARAQVTIQRAVLFPQINAQPQVLRGTANTAGSLTSEPYTTGNSFGLTAALTYPIDLWGVGRDNLRASTETLKSTRFAKEQVALSLVANVADTYFSVLALRKRAAIVREDVAAINEILQIIKLKVATGSSSHLDLAQEEAQVESVESQLPMLVEQELEARVTLATLLGQPPESFEIEGSDPDTIVIPSVGPGLPSGLLLRRPEVAEAEANLASAHANLNAARAAFLPQFSLTGNSGYASGTIGTLLQGPSFVWNAGFSLVQTIFDGGKLIGQKALADAKQEELIASYQGAVLSAYADVVTALGQVMNERQVEEHLRREVDSASQAFEIAELQYRQGAGDLIVVLQSQQTLFAARDQLVQTTLARMQAGIHLYESLGGGWIEQTDDRTQFMDMSAPHSGRSDKK